MPTCPGLLAGVIPEAAEPGACPQWAELCRGSDAILYKSLIRALSQLPPDQSKDERGAVLIP